MKVIGFTPGAAWFTLVHAGSNLVHAKTAKEPRRKGIIPVGNTVGSLPDGYCGQEYQRVFLSGVLRLLFYPSNQLLLCRQAASHFFASWLLCGLCVNQVTSGVNQATSGVNQVTSGVNQAAPGVNPIPFICEKQKNRPVRKSPPRFVTLPLLRAPGAVNLKYVRFFQDDPL